MIRVAKTSIWGIEILVSCFWYPREEFMDSSLVGWFVSF